MNSTTLPQRITLPSDAPAAARTVFRLLGHLRQGSLDVQLPDGSSAHFGGSEGPRAALRIRDWAVCSAALRSGDIGFAESFVAGHWSTPDLRALLELFVRNREALDEVIFGSWWGALLHRVKHLLNRNSRAGSRKNIHAHYDLGNAFYRLWLDESMNYSSAWFGGERQGSLAEAQAAKMRRALEECQVGAGSRVLEIGCGWGAVAETAVRDFGAHLTGVTLSSEQLAWAQERLARAGLADGADLRFQDYRDITDPAFDAVVSIEMFEAVGREYWDGYFQTVAAKLKPGGRACIQTITIRDDLFERYARSSDFIQQYIFPGGMLPSPTQFRAHAAKAGLRVVNELAFGQDYARTLHQWREAFLRQEGPVRELGFDTRFMRLWEFYLAYCEAAFAADNTDVMQFTLQREG
ncbi:SAM-dependent methyltransferase [Paucibacter sp. DJ2R-2]|uniref:SAM-dependent methyltransferase n=1 Tax=Paucibacter sp. DJ2R-2 TaxID=2893558 RepID=UPI0021E35978|nr:cyclopropane-fatty-acyl-phospholipid synthase family protein [Paucibacter sp. DJ2R-2]MCV2419700.1 cyclopropane-fatty-acyl-phospholipid synthase family protein [Paucibacter sp. DJ4R-1]MCV2437397.1 cyclopropane-fatty-acyl-phospholipid synthase family protein [Paucibacter sp. DJ2R-2]